MGGDGRSHGLALDGKTERRLADPIGKQPPSVAGGLKLLAEVRLALTIAFYPKYAYVLSAIGALAMLALLPWTSPSMNGRRR